MTEKERQSIELLDRVRGRLKASPYAHLYPKAAEIVVGFLLCHDEMQKMQDTLKDGQTDE